LIYNTFESTDFNLYFLPHDATQSAVLPRQVVRVRPWPVCPCVRPLRWGITYTVFRKNTHSHFLSYLRELFVDLNKNCSKYTQGLIDSDNVKIRYSFW